MTEQFFDEEELLKPETFARLDRGELQPKCKKCRSTLEILRMGVEQKGPIFLIRCPKNKNHFGIHLHYKTSIDSLVRGEITPVATPPDSSVRPDGRRTDAGRTPDDEEK